VHICRVSPMGVSPCANSQSVHNLAQRNRPDLSRVSGNSHKNQPFQRNWVRTAKPPAPKMIDLAYLYGALANGGILRTPATIRHAASGRVSLPDPVLRSRRVFSEVAAFLGLQMMTAPLQPYGTANGAWRQMQLASGPHYAKTGTGQVSDAIYVSILGNRRLLLLAWVGMDDNESLSMARGFQGASAAMPIVTTVLRQLNAARPELFEPRPLEVPASLTPVQVSEQRGCLVESGGFTAYVAPDRTPGPCPAEVKRAGVQENRRATRRGAERRAAVDAGHTGPAEKPR